MGFSGCADIFVKLALSFDLAMILFQNPQLFIHFTAVAIQQINNFIQIGTVLIVAKKRLQFTQRHAGIFEAANCAQPG